MTAGPQQPRSEAFIARRALTNCHTNVSRVGRDAMVNPHNAAGLPLRERSDAAISIAVGNGMGIAPLRSQ